MLDWIVPTLMLLGAMFMLLAALGILRMPDMFLRMQVTSKAATLGIACVFIAVALHFGDLGLTMRALLVVLFTFLTAPVGAHALGRAAYLEGEPLWDGTVLDEMRQSAQPPPGPRQP